MSFTAKRKKKANKIKTNSSHCPTKTIFKTDITPLSVFTGTLATYEGLIIVENSELKTLLYLFKPTVHEEKKQNKIKLS